ncbi:crt [Symbiodinium sp. CCMP2456]|nr:crt [Symbiodinium sp. CCMP2456]
METDSAQMSASAAWHTSSRRSEREHGSVLVEALFANLSSLALSSSLSIGQNASDSLNKMESLLLSLGRQPTTDSNMVETATMIGRILEDSMKATIRTQLALQQKSLETAVGTISACASHLKYDEAKVLREQLPALAAAHQDCRKEEGIGAQSVEECEESLAEHKTSHATARIDCDAVVDYPAGGRGLCNNRVGSVADHYRNLHTFWDEYLKWYDGNMTICNALQAKVESTTANCSNLSVAHDAQRRKCNARQAQLDTTSCGFVTNAENGCAAYSRCYDQTLASFITLNSTVAEEERTLRQEWRAVLRIECLLKALLSDNKNAAIDRCIGRVHSLDEISVDYSPVPRPLNETYPHDTLCKNLTEYVPVTEAYAKRWYDGLPSSAQEESRIVRFCPSKSGGPHHQAQAMQHACKGKVVVPTRSQVSFSSSSVAQPGPGLDAETSWAPAEARAGEFLTVDLGEEVRVGGTYVQGGSLERRCLDSWVTTYMVQYSVNGSYSSLPEALRGSHDCSAKVGTRFDVPLQARFLRFVMVCQDSMWRSKDTAEEDWETIERVLAAKEAELLQQEGSSLEDSHVSGYRYVPTTKVVDKQSWETFAVPHIRPTCGSENWHHKDVLFEIGEGIAYITLNRPEANNALNETTSQALQDATCELHMRRDIRIVVLRAEGSMFCAGGDPKHFFDALAMAERDDRKAAIGFMKFLFWFQSLPQFTVGLAQGSAMGSGIGLLCACDMVLAASAARFTCSEVKLGFCPAALAPFVTRKVGPAFAKRLLCMAENISAEQAKRMGLISDVVEEESEFSDYMKDICEKVTLCAPTAAGRAKRLAQNVSLQPLTRKLLEYTGGELADIRIGEEAIKGMVAVQARVKPYWAETPIKPLY